MAQKAKISEYAKVSREFATRLAGFAPNQMVRAVVLLRTRDAQAAVQRRLNLSDREAIRLAIGRQAEAALPEVDRVLRQFGGKRLSSAADALGRISVETTAAGIRSLASLDGVKAVLQDQQISALHSRKLDSLRSR